MPTFTIPDNFTISDAEFLQSKQEQEAVYCDEGGRQADRTHVDPLGHARWDTDYVTMRMAGYTHVGALQEMRVRIREAWTPPLPAVESHVPPPAPPQPTGLLVGPGNFRAPDPEIGGVLPLPSYGEAVVESVGRAFPQLLLHSCQDAPDGSWEFLDWAVDTLRTHDLRWGYNGKRGNRLDPSKDVVAYHRGRGPSPDSTAVYIIDVIGGHCGESPSVIFNDVTQITLDSGTIGRWITRGRF